MMRKLYIGLIGLLFVVGGCVASQTATKTKDVKKPKERTAIAAVQAQPETKTSDLNTVMAEGVSEAKANDVLGIGTGTATIAVEERDGRIYVAITNPLLTPKGDTKKKSLKLAVRVKVASGILDAAGKKPYFAVAQVNNGNVQFNLPNFAKAVKEPVVEHIWGYGEAADGTIGYLVLDPESQWVSYETDASGNPDLETLAIGIIMYPDKPVVPLKSIGKGKLAQGRHSELK